MHKKVTFADQILEMVEEEDDLDNFFDSSESFSHSQEVTNEQMQLSGRKFNPNTFLTEKKKSGNHRGDRMVPMRGSNDNSVRKFEAAACKEGAIKNASQAFLYESQMDLSQRSDILNLAQNYSSGDSSASPSQVFDTSQILQFSEKKAQRDSSQHPIQQIQNLSTNRYTETRQLQEREKRHQKKATCQYEQYAALDSVGILGTPFLFQLFDWGKNDLCAAGISNIVYVFSAQKECQAKQITVCHDPFKITCLKWLEAESKFSCESLGLAVATTDPSGVIQIWDTVSFKMIRRINSCPELFTALTFGNHYLIGSTIQGHLVVNDLRQQSSEIGKMELFKSMGAKDELLHVAFSQDGQYLVASGSLIHVMKFMVNLIGEISMEKTMAILLPLDKSFMSAWSPVQTSLFAFGTYVPLQNPQGQSDSQQPEEIFMSNNQTYRYEVKFMNAESRSQVASVELPSPVRSLLWSRQFNPQDKAQFVFCGMLNGAIAIIKFSGLVSQKAELMNLLEFHDKSVLFVKESPDANFVGSIGEDEILFIWRRKGLAEGEQQHQQRNEFLESREIAEGGLMDYLQIR